jgi:hypothetical protein
MTPEQAFKHLRKKLKLTFFIEVILMAWSIWTIRNDWIFNNEDPTLDKCKRKFVAEFRLLLYRSKTGYSPPNPTVARIHHVNIPYF